MVPLASGIYLHLKGLFWQAVSSLAITARFNNTTCVGKTIVSIVNQSKSTWSIQFSYELVILTQGSLTGSFLLPNANLDTILYQIIVVDMHSVEE